MTGVDQTIHDGFGDDRVLEEFEPTLRLDLGSDDERALLVALFEYVHEGGSLFVGVISKSEVIKDEGLGLPGRDVYRGQWPDDVYPNRFSPGLRDSPGYKPYEASGRGQ